MRSQKRKKTFPTLLIQKLSKTVFRFGFVRLLVPVPAIHGALHCGPARFGTENRPSKGRPLGQEWDGGVSFAGRFGGW